MILSIDSTLSQSKTKKEKKFYWKRYEIHLQKLKQLNNISSNLSQSYWYFGDETVGVARQKN